jgi:2-dehydropantoate 2-reductase
MKTAVFGAGGVGAYFGALLARDGHEVHFLARGAHLAEMQTHGLRIKSPHGDFTLDPVLATDAPGDVGPVEYLVVAVKHYDLALAVPKLLPMVAEETTVVPLLNGVDAHEVLADALGGQHVVGGFCALVSMIEAPGVIRHESKLHRIVIGELDGRRSERTRRFIHALKACGVKEAEASENILLEMWRKFLFIASLGGIGSLSQATVGEMLASEETRALLIDAMKEVRAVGVAAGIDLPKQAVDEAVAFLKRFESSATTSMQRDVAAGRRFELEAFSGYLVKKARQLQVPTPIHRTIYGALLPALIRAS